MEKSDNLYKDKNLAKVFIKPIESNIKTLDNIQSVDGVRRASEQEIGADYIKYSTGELFRVNDNAKYKIKFNIERNEDWFTWTSFLITLPLTVVTLTYFPGYYPYGYIHRIDIYDGENKIKELTAKTPSSKTMWVFMVYQSEDVKPLQQTMLAAYDFLIPLQQADNEAITSLYKFSNNPAVRHQIAKRACERYQQYLEEDKKIGYTTRVSVNPKLTDSEINKVPYNERPIQYIAECNFTFTEAGTSTQKTESVPIFCGNEIKDASQCLVSTPRTEKEIQKSEEREKERKQADREREANRRAEEKCKKQCILDWTGSTGDSCPALHANYNQCYKCRRNCE